MLLYRLFFGLSLVRNMLNTVSDYLQWGIARCNEAQVYLGHGTDDLWEEVLSLVLYVLNIPPNSDVRVLQDPVSKEEGARILSLIKRRIEERIPAAYLTKEAWFAGLPFYVDERVLIPRSPLAEVIEANFHPWIKPEKVTRILDVCTGSGCIAIACAKAFPNVKIDALDISKDALAVARENVTRHQVEGQVQLIQSDMFEALGAVQYDVIISNPPYVPESELRDLPKEYSHEPTLGLYADDDGLAFAETILQNAKRFLSPRGVLIVEVGNSAEALHQRYSQLPFLWLDFARGGDGVFLLTMEQLI